MDAKTRKALEGSIKKWRKIVEWEDTDNGISNCPLCALFWSARCSECPVKRATGKRECGGTPYVRWAKAQYKAGGFDAIEIRGLRPFDPQTQRLAEEELKFLISLRPR